MRIFGLISLLIWLAIFIALAIMFDWFGSRELAREALVGSEVVIEYLEKTGDSAQKVIHSVTEEAEAVKKEVNQATQ
ncbi:MAG: hypothetical protein JXR44_08540 [Thiotrichales bacterium]|nr:hypothetical protein [Thiotrichales bacterium]